MNFNDAVLEWLKRHGAPAGIQPVSVERVETYGTDWRGDTFSGFDGHFELTIYYKRSDGSDAFLDVDGEAMQSLWMHVVGAWPENVETVTVPRDDLRVLLRRAGVTDDASVNLSAALAKVEEQA